MSINLFIQSLIFVLHQFAVPRVLVVWVFDQLPHNLKSLRHAWIAAMDYARVLGSVVRVAVPA